MRKPTGFPTERDIIADIAGDFSTFDALAADGTVSRLIPGFEKVRVGGVEVGRWLTELEAFGEGSDEIVGAEFTDDSVTQKVTVFRRPEFKLRYQAHQRRLAAARVASAPAKDDPEKRIENAIADARRAAGHVVRQQVSTPGGIVDIVDETAKVVIECKASAKTTFVMQAVDQLDRYIPHFGGYAQALGLPEAPLNDATSRALLALNIAVFTLTSPLDDKGAA